ncbi:hypothetical protein [Hymenobacter daeguensis]
MSSPLATRPADAAPVLKGFKAFELNTSRNPVPSYNRLDFYKASLVTGHIVVQYAGQRLELNGTHLFFAAPHLAYTTLLLSARVTGYACLFTEAFVQANGWFDGLPRFSLFQRGGLCVCELAHEQAAYSTGIFEKMLAAQHTDYLFKGELVGSYLHLLLHEGLRIQRRETRPVPAPTASGNPSLLPG